MTENETAVATSPQTLDGLVQQAIQNAITAPSLMEKIQKAADKAISDSIESVCGWSSPFRKGLEANIAKCLPIVDVDDLATFSNAVRMVIQKRLANLASETASTHMDQVLAQILPDAPVVTMKELREAYVEKIKEKASRDDCHCDEIEDEYIAYTWQIEEAKNSHGYWDLWMSPEEDASRYSGKDVICLRFKPANIPGELHDCWHASMGQNDKLVSTLFCGPIRGFDAMVFRLVSGTAKLQK